MQQQQCNDRFVTAGFIMKSILFPPTALVAALMLASLAGCDRYRVTLNDQVISEPPKLLSTVEVVDPLLASCLEQTIQDQQIHTTADLKVLVCTHAGITSLQGIEAFSSIETINLAQNNLTSIAPLVFLGQLKSVNLQENPQLNCDEILKLKQHLPEQGVLLPPAHCLP